jgi:hypothetical protein
VHRRPTFLPNLKNSFFFFFFFFSCSTNSPKPPNTDSRTNSLPQASKHNSFFGKQVGREDFAAIAASFELVEKVPGAMERTSLQGK